MHWTSFMFGFVAGSLLFDLLWRITMHMSNRLLVEQRKYIETLEALERAP